MRVSAVLSNAPYLLNVDCDHYINNSKALREAMCFMMDPTSGKRVCYVQFPQRFDGIDRHDRYSNRNVVFFDVCVLFLFVCCIHPSIYLFNCIFLCTSLLLQSLTSTLKSDQHERLRWFTRTHICWDWMCFQKASTLWIWCTCQEEAPWQNLQLFAKMVLWHWKVMLEKFLIFCK